jgi:hypothetical protein
MTGRKLQLVARNLRTMREAKCLSIIELALSLLRAQDDLPETEVDLNRRLFFCLYEATRKLYPDDEIGPGAECCNQPDPDDKVRARREQKRPDFQWIYVDRYEPDARRSSRQFVVECKRLGEATRADWVLNRNYTDHGIERFRDPEWAYAKGMQTGAMVGYWQSMEGEEVLSKVNEGCHTRSIPDLILVGAWRPNGTSRFEHSLERPFEVSPFRLHHLWVDLRS